MRIFGRCWALLLFLGFAGGSARAAVDFQNGPSTSLRAGSQFAIADFDGDVRPDLASVQAELNNSGSYWIQLQLSAVGKQSIRLVAPAGGLIIEARDVNGDHAIDLVLATAWSRQPVAILLNDGHGGFSRVESGKFPGAFAQSNTNWDSASNQAADLFGLPPQSGTGICVRARGPLGGHSPAAPICYCSPQLLDDTFLLSHAGRAPPPEALSFD